MYDSEFAGSEMFAKPTGSVATVIARAEPPKNAALLTASVRTTIRFMTERGRRLAKLRRIIFWSKDNSVTCKIISTCFERFVRRLELSIERLQLLTRQRFQKPIINRSDTLTYCTICAFNSARA